LTVAVLSADCPVQPSLPRTLFMFL
jgi:hypothetical protein